MGYGFGFDWPTAWLLINIFTVIVFIVLLVDDWRNIQAYRAAERIDSLRARGQIAARDRRIVAIGAWCRNLSRLASSIVGLVLGLWYFWAANHESSSSAVLLAQWLPAMLVVMRVFTLLEGVSDRWDRRKLRERPHK